MQKSRCVYLFLSFFVWFIQSNRSLAPNWMACAGCNTILVSPLCWANIKIERYLLIAGIANVFVAEPNTALTLTHFSWELNIVRAKSVYVHAFCVCTNIVVLVGLSMCARLFHTRCLAYENYSYTNHIPIVRSVVCFYFSVVVFIRPGIGMICSFVWRTREYEMMKFAWASTIRFFFAFSSIYLK